MHLIIIIAVSVFSGLWLFRWWSTEPESFRQFCRRNYPTNTPYVSEWERIVTSWGPEYAAAYKKTVQKTAEEEARVAQIRAQQAKPPATPKA